MNVPIFAVKIPRGLNAPHGNTVKFTTKREQMKYLHRCCDACKPITIPVTR